MPERQRTPDPRLGQAMRRMRELRRLTLRQVADRMGRKPSFITHIARWERGTTSPSADNLWRYLRAIGASFAALERELRPPTADVPRRLIGPGLDDRRGGHW